jgi:hypothetical protein
MVKPPEIDPGGRVLLVVDHCKMKAGVFDADAR